MRFSPDSRDRGRGGNSHRRGDRNRYGSHRGCFHGGGGNVRDTHWKFLCDTPGTSQSIRSRQNSNRKGYR